jgi:hypothetical protein
MFAAPCISDGINVFVVKISFHDSDTSREPSEQLRAVGC